MRYYEIHLLGKTTPGFTTNARRLRNLPDGTRVHAIIEDRDGTLIDTWELPVVDGRVVFEKRSGQVRTPNTYTA